MDMKIKIHNETANDVEGYSGVDSVVEIDGRPMSSLQGISFGMNIDSLIPRITMTGFLFSFEFETDHPNNAIPTRITFTESDRVLELPIALHWPKSKTRTNGRATTYDIAGPTEIKLLHGNTLGRVLNATEFSFGSSIDDLEVCAEMKCLGKDMEVEELTPLYTLGSADPKTFLKKIVRY